MKVAQKLKIALDETRIVVLGAQILLGFQLRGSIPSCQRLHATSTVWRFF
jgi:hypothetical protein